MSSPQIIDKLSIKLNSRLTSEEDVVYVLSRIRKILEIDDYPEKYRILKFYCDLALHARIDRYPKIVGEMLRRVHEGTDYSNSIINFTDFHSQFKDFLDEKGLPDLYKSHKISDLNKILNSIYSDTPITLRAVEYEITVNSDGSLTGGSIKDISKPDAEK